MFQNHFKIALRNFRKSSSQGVLNLAGLTLGLAICMLIAIFIANELSFDKYHQNASRIWRVNRIFYNLDGSEQLHLGHLAPPFAPLLKNDFPDIEQATRLLQNGIAVRRGEARYVEDDLFFAEPEVFKVFDIPLAAGNPQTALAEPFTVLLSETTAKKYFDKEDPVNQTLKADSGFDLKVTGVFKDFPYNSHWHPDLLVSFATLNDTTIYGAEGLRTNWGNNSFSTFLLLPEKYPTERLEAQFPAFIDKHMGQAYMGAGKPASQLTKLDLTPLTDIHLRSHLDSEIEGNGDIKRVWIFSAIALFVLLIACINYMNLSTAYAAIRGKEIGIRQVSGARRSELVGQFLTESVLLALIATLLAGAMVSMTLPFVNQVFGQTLQVRGAQAGWMLAGAVGLALLTGLAAGAYPAFFMSSLKPIQVLKGSTGSPFRGSGGSGGVLRKALVVSQFTISTVLIIATIVVFRQLKFMQDKSLGLSKEHVLTMNFYAPLAPKYESFRTEMLSNPVVKNMTRSSRIPSGRLLDSFGSAKIQLGAGDSLRQTTADLKFLTVDHRFADTYGLGVSAGRFYEKDEGSDRLESFIVNEIAVEKLGWKSAQEAVGMKINYGGRDARIVGVLKDFNFESLHQQIQPMIFFIPRDSTFFNALSLKVDGAKTQEAIAHVKTVWERFLPEYPFDYQFLDAQYDQLYEAEQRQGKIFVGFALLAILVACLGLFGLARFVAQQRVKEIGVRKVLGATTPGIVGLLSKDFLKLVIVALVIASPVAWYFMNQWLENFAYRIAIQWWVFLAAGAAAVAIAFLTVSFQSVRAALANPVKSLRSE